MRGMYQYPTSIASIHLSVRLCNACSSTIRGGLESSTETEECSFRISRISVLEVWARSASAGVDNALESARLSPRGRAFL